jgi:ribosomal protein L37AE/L43A
MCPECEASWYGSQSQNYQQLDDGMWQCQECGNILDLR